MIVVTTPTGRIGRRVVELLLAATDPASVRVVTRDPAALDPRVRAAVQVVAGSHCDPAALDRAFDGADSVFWLVPPDPRAPGTATDHYLGFAAPACEALAKRRVRRVVAVTSLGHGYPHDAGTLSAAFAMDAAFQHSGVGYRGLAAPFFLENLFSQTNTVDAFHKMLLGFGVSAGWAQGVADMVRAQNDGIYDAEPHLPPIHVPHLSQPTAFRTWCEQQLKPAVDAA
ncbi:NAD(P)H-binding protein [Catenulispora sp. NL8]|uniref:NAD(P)H-binding protein n=1 Tax=Catenulispora pinistramenti TaxID=2705254 RepID=A0ABS5L7K3_9ACTN|nr:NAD(P)H-binding protein [Catenulispora pinistramenti]MBS2554343.1 NAD(P)H-binding protein [Catenulispora pinistramenti]